jgi:periplasmic divalent cation tolerance protein
MRNVVVFITASGEEEALKIARAAVQERLAACVNIIQGVRSIYRWKGKVEDDSEVLMVLKTRESQLEALHLRVRQLHSYEVPEVIAMPITWGSEPYLKWMEEATAKSSGAE